MDLLGHLIHHLQRGLHRGPLLLDVMLGEPEAKAREGW
jgi:hypothetical protein